jgi:hypothetical protein
MSKNDGKKPAFHDWLNLLKMVSRLINWREAGSAAARK